jgi:hypothetical protein
MNEKVIRRKYLSKISSTRGRVDKNGMAIEMRLTYEEYRGLWQDFGVMPGQPYVLSRINDIGHYEIGNVFIQHVVGNATDSHGLESGLDKRINEYVIKTGYKRRTVKNMIKRGELEL